MFPNRLGYICPAKRASFRNLLAIAVCNFFPSSDHCAQLMRPGFCAGSDPREDAEHAGTEKV
ncbi:hypothetical protein, partial [Amycolatopsis sp. CA-126428]|uniref:hypothetical protein n=1 Tax=Amycolatopsis sp. CA-126428 TaxID=2073158 RepID=UPI001E6459C0